MNRLFLHPTLLLVYTDGAIRPERGLSGLAAIVRGEGGRILHWKCRQAGRMTCNEAEYAAAIMALEFMHSLRPQEIRLYSDSQVLVQQMSGLAAARAPALRQAQIRLRSLVLGYQRVSFHHIPREQNRLADALANEVVDGDGREWT
ncbi:MAG: ribonuclease HI family protein [Chloroflexi bacterium]|nr:ribonuclease HI family protein [Chloroflexota bacterium]